MEKILECIPNFSEGKNPETIDKILKAIEKIPQVKVLDFSSDIDHNRSVITFAGDPYAVIEAAFQAAKTAAELIDVKKHQGIHPRIGATDVIPFVPIKGISDHEAVELAHKLGQRLGEELKIPVYFYEKAAKSPERKNLANVRNIGFEKLKEEILTDAKYAPDFGPAQIGSAGATAIGVRLPLIAYNVNLKTDNLEIAQKIAKKIREKDGGLSSVKALGLHLESRGLAQISMNLTNYKETSPRKVFDLIAEEVKKLGTEILESELIGLIPQDALKPDDIEHLKFRNFTEKQVLENHF